MHRKQNPEPERRFVRQRDRVPTLPPSAWVGKKEPESGDARQQCDRPLTSSACGERRHHRQKQCREPGAEEPAETPHAMKGGHDRPAVAALDRDGMGIHRHVHHPVRRTEEERRRQEQAETWRDQRKREGHHQRRRGDAGYRGAAKSCDYGAGQRHRGERAECHREQRDAEGRVADLQALLDQRDMRGPGADHHAVHEEDCGNGPAGARNGGGGLSHDLFLERGRAGSGRSFALLCRCDQQPGVS